MARKWIGRYSHYDLGLGSVSSRGRPLISHADSLPRRNGGGKVWGSDDVNVEGWKALKRLAGHDSGLHGLIAFWPDFLADILSRRH